MENSRDGRKGFGTVHLPLQIGGVSRRAVVRLLAQGYYFEQRSPRQAPPILCMAQNVIA